MLKNPTQLTLSSKMLVKLVLLPWISLTLIPTWKDWTSSWRSFVEEKSFAKISALPLKLETKKSLG
jgi:hypothetical protein